MLLQLPEVAQQIETDGIREELAEHYETAGQSAADRISCHPYLSILKILMQGIVMWAHADLTAKNHL